MRRPASRLRTVERWVHAFLKRRSTPAAAGHHKKYRAHDGAAGQNHHSIYLFPGHQPAEKHAYNRVQETATAVRVFMSSQK